ncbi:MAG: non-hydrolyzing UDP-N-acetylglucosamine 2-epimerase [Actinomycetota bacterium]
MKVVTILGTRPEIIRLRCVIDVLDGAVDHVLVHTGQNFHDRLSRLFFEELELREPDHHLGIEATGFADQAGQIITAAGKVLEAERPDALLVLGDTNSGLSSIVAKRMGMPVYHMEAGNRCYDDRVPEEVNRRVIDHCSSVLLPYTYRSKENLVAEGIERQRIFVTGNPIREVLLRYEDRITESRILQDLDVKPGQYFLVTAHRAETVDDRSRLAPLIASLEAVARRWELPLVCSLHPRTRERMSSLGVSSTQVKFLEPMGLFDFVALEKQALGVLTDSGTVQEECCIYGVPAVTLRDVTERPETIECGSNIIAGVEPDLVEASVKLAVARRGEWEPPPEYLVKNVSATVTRILLGSSDLGKE